MDMKSFGRATAGVPTQSFAASNFIGTPVPQLGSVGPTPNLSNTTGGGKKMHVALIIALLIVAGYVGHHYFFEK